MQVNRLIFQKGHFYGDQKTADSGILRSALKKKPSHQKILRDS